MPGNLKKRFDEQYNSRELCDGGNVEKLPQSYNGLHGMVLPGQGQPGGGHDDRNGWSAAPIGDQVVCQFCSWVGRSVGVLDKASVPSGKRCTDGTVSGRSGEFYCASMDGVRKRFPMV